MPTDFESWLRSKLLFLGFTALTVGVAYAGYKLYQRARSSPSSSSSPQEGYRYAGLPSACRCESCGYILEKPSTHCRAIRCPQCGGTMWRVK